jgi:uncharacterized peroxidase-related enzyme
MNRMPLVNRDHADETSGPILESLQRLYGEVPNFYAGLANSSGAMKAYMDFEVTLIEKSSLTKRQHELISLLVANMNGCHYCVSGHTYVLKRMGFSDAQAREVQVGNADDDVDAAVLAVAKDILANRGHLDDAGLARARTTGLTNAQIIEIAAWVGINSIGNYVNNIIRPEIDFPLVDVVEAAGALS